MPLFILKILIILLTVYDVLGNNKMDIEMESVYENSDKITKSKGKDEIYSNTESTIQLFPNRSGCYGLPKKNKDGLIYADLDLSPSGKGFVIRGIENRNNYAIIDLSKTAVPLTSDDEDVDQDSNKINSAAKIDE